MALTCASAFTTKAPCFLQSRARAAGRVALPVSPVCSSRRAEQNASPEVRLTKLAGVSTAVSTLLAAGNAQAAQEVANLATKDNRAGLLALLLTPALGWVAFNILSPALNQLKGMQNANAKRSAAIGLGLGAALVCSQSADAAEEIAQLAAGRDNRVFIIATLFVPVVGWVGFNILGPALNQLQAQVKKNSDGTAGKLKSKIKGRR
ncbi:hypothetical protein ABBQ38_003146 [Trebouxia sp. C0009 RCD-2024]